MGSCHYIVPALPGGRPSTPKATRFGLALLVFALVCLFIRPEKARAAACEDVFPDGASSTTTTGSITFNNLSEIYYSPDKILDTYRIVDYAYNTCYTQDCTKSNKTVPTGTYAIPTTGSDITVGSSTNYYLAPGIYRNVSIGSSTNLYMAPGDYIITGRIDIQYLADLIINAAGTVRIWAKSGIYFHSYTDINDAGGDRRLFLYSKGVIDIQNNSRVKAIAYADGDVPIGSDTYVTGAVTAGGNITLGNDTSIIFSSSAVSGTEFGSFCEKAISHFDINVGSGSASTCLPQNITVAAMNAAGQRVTGYTGTISLTTSTSRGDWSKTNTSTDALGSLSAGGANSGSAGYAFDSAGNDQGDITLRLSNAHAETLTVTVSDSTAGVSSTSTNLTFAENVFVVSSLDSLAEDVVAGRPHAMRVQMMRRDVTTGVCGPASNYNASSVKAWLSRDASDPGGAGPTLTNAAGSASVQLPNSEPASANLSLPVVSGSANFSLQAADVGKYSINVRDSSLSFSQAVINGGSSSLVARPFGLALSVTGNPGAADASGLKFQAAGSDFNVSARAVAWQAADDANNDGLPDGHADSDPTNNASLADNASLPSFGSEAPGESITLTAYLISPAGGADPGLGSSRTAPADGRVVSGFTSGSGSTGSVFFNEVGVAELVAGITDGQYLSSAKAVGGRSGRVGRFTPATFSLSAGSLAPACTQALDFSYMGQSFDANYTATALSARGTTTANYEGSYAKLSDALGQVTLGAIDAAAPVSMDARLSASNHRFTWLQGRGSVQTNLVLQRAAAPDGPIGQLETGVRLQDADGIGFAPADLNLDSDINGSSDKISLGQTEVRFGRLRLDPSFGPETADLPVVLLAEYWDGAAWRTNQDDSCTLLALSAVTYPSGTIDITANRSVSVGGGTSTGTYPVMTPTDIGFANGNARHYFTAPGAGNTGTFAVNTDLSAYPWLWFDWNGDGNYSDSALPAANYTFGAYRGHDRVLYWQEILN